jgi:hypothetical protein
MVRGTADGVAYQTLDNGSWHVGWRYLPVPGSTPFGPALAGTCEFCALGGIDPYVIGQDQHVWGQSLKVSSTDRRQIIFANQFFAFWAKAT